MQINIRKQIFNVEVGSNKEAWEYINTEKWENNTFDILDSFVKKDSRVIDLGSWSGVLSLYMANIGARVHALDPDPICFTELNANIALNTNLKSKITTYQIAISDKNEKINLHARNAYGQSSTSILERSRDKVHTAKVPSMTLEYFLTNFKIEHIDFIKMDVEGAEFKILPTINEALKKVNYPTLFVSFHYNYLVEHIYNCTIKSRFLNKIIYKLYKKTKIVFFKTKLNLYLNELFMDLATYKYVYTDAGKPVSFKIIQNNPSLIKEINLVFTNTKWESKIG